MATKRKALDKGLSAILGEDWHDNTDVMSVSMINVEDIVNSPNQARSDFDDETLAGLSDSIREQGILEPILVRSKGGKYEIIAGERRWRASKMAELEEIPAIVLNVDDPKKLSLIGLVENLQREDLNVIDEALAYQSLKTNYNMTQEEISKAVGRSRPVVANTLRILNLPPKIIDMVKAGILTAGHTRILLSIDDETRQLRLALLAAKKQMSVEALAQYAEKDLSKPGRKGIKKDPKLEALAEELQEALATKVSITKNKRKGRIVIEFYDEDELYSIIRRFGD